MIIKGEVEDFWDGTQLPKGLSLWNGGRASGMKDVCLHGEATYIIYQR